MAGGLCLKLSGLVCTAQHTAQVANFRKILTTKNMFMVKTWIENFYGSPETGYIGKYVTRKYWGWKNNGHTPQSSKGSWQWWDQFSGKNRKKSDRRPIATQMSLPEGCKTGTHYILSATYFLPWLPRFWSQQNSNLPKHEKSKNFPSNFSEAIFPKQLLLLLNIRTF